MRKSILALGVSGLLLGSGAVQALDADAIIGGGIGGAAGAAVGSELGGRNGAIAGSAVGAAIGTAVATNGDGSARHAEQRERVHYGDDDDYRGPPPHAYRAPPGHVKHHRH